MQYYIYKGVDIVENSIMANMCGGIPFDVEIPKEEYDLYKFLLKKN